MNPTDQNNQDEDYNTNQPNGQPTSLDNSTDSTRSFNQPSPNSQSPNINISGPNIQTSSPKMPSMNFGRPETNQANPSFQSSPGFPPKKSKKGLVIALIILILALGAGAAYYFLVMSKDKSNTTQSNSNTSESQDTEESSELVKTVYSTHEKQSDSPVKVSVEHPLSWTIERNEDEDRDSFMIKGDMKIVSPEGHVLSFQDASWGGYGGDCSEDVDVTLIKRVPTKSEGYIFEQIQYNDNEYTRGMKFRKLNDKDNVYLNDYTQEAITTFDALKEGGTFKGDCHAVFNYPSVKNNEDNATLFVFVKDGASKDLTYDQIKDDTEFIAMLQSLEIVKE